MTPRDDFPGEMEEFPFDETAADAVFGPARGADSAPEELRDFADLVHAARRTGSADELVGEDVIVARIAAAMGEPAAPPQRGAHERIVVLKKFRTAKVAAGATAVLLLGGTAAAAAATGSLPTSTHHHHHVALAVVHTSAEPRHHESHAPNISGAVASVNGGTVAGTCGVSGNPGVFTLTTHKGNPFTINVATTTAFTEHGVAAPTFVDVCVGAKVKVTGTVVDTTVTAGTVKIKPPHVRMGAEGTVASVNGVSDPGTCGVSRLPGSFTITGHGNKTFTVNVDPSTKFADEGVASPSFVNVCVGEFVAAKGTVTDPIVAATDVFIAPKPDDKKHDDHGQHMGAFGAVASVNGLSTAGVCGAPGNGSFTVTGRDGTTFTVNVTSTTTFDVHGVTDPTFSNVCVGEKVGASGAVTGTTVAATDVFVSQPGNEGDHHHGHKGKGHDHDADHHDRGDDREGDANSGKHEARLSADRHDGSTHNGGCDKGSHGGGANQSD